MDHSQYARDLKGNRNKLLKFNENTLIMLILNSQRPSHLHATVGWVEMGVVNTELAISYPVRKG